MSFNHTTSQLWSSQLGVRFGAFATLRPEPTTTTVASGLHTSAVIDGGDEGPADGPVNLNPFAVCSADTVQNPTPSVQPHSRDVDRPPNPFSEASYVAVNSEESVAAFGTGTAATAGANSFLPRSSGFGPPTISLFGTSIAALPGVSIASPVAGAATGADGGADAAADAGTDAGARPIVEPPATPLEFSISKEEFLAARAAIPGTSQAHWSHTMYHRAGENGAVDNVKVHYCESKATAERVCKEYFFNEDVLGFDLEWMKYATRTDGPRQNVSLIQIASPSRIALIHVALFAKEDGDLVAPSLRKILESPNVSKVGVNIGGDCTRLKNYLGVTVRGVFELSHLYKVVKYLPEKPFMVNKGLVSLATQVEDHLLLPLYKGQIVRTGNWMRRLNPQQIHCKLPFSAQADGCWMPLANKLQIPHRMRMQAFSFTTCSTRNERQLYLALQDRIMRNFGYPSPSLSLQSSRLKQGRVPRPWILQQLLLQTERPPHQDADLTSRELPGVELHH